MKTKTSFYFSIFSLVTILFVFTVNAQTPAQSVGQGFLEIAENWYQLADFAKSKKFCEKAIVSLNQVRTKSGELSKTDQKALSQAYFLKANLLKIFDTNRDAIQKELLNALKANPQFQPPDNYKNHSDIIQLWVHVKENEYKNHLEAKLTEAFNFYDQQKYCSAYNILKPIISHYQQQVATTIFNQCKKKCTPLSTTKPQVATNKLIGIFPVIHAGTHGEKNRKEIDKTVFTEKHIAQLKKKIPGVDILPISKETADSFKHDFKFKDYNEFIVKYITEISIKKAIVSTTREKSLELPSLGGITPSEITILNKIGEKLNSDYLLFIQFQGEMSDREGERRFNITLNVYSENPAKLLIRKNWQKKDIRDLENIKTKINEILQMKL